MSRLKKLMATFSNLATTALGIASKPTTSSKLGAIANAYKVAKNTPGGVLGKISNDKVIVKGTNTSALNANKGASYNPSQFPEGQGPLRAPADIFSASKSSGSGSGSGSSADAREKEKTAKMLASIGRGWDDTGDVFNATKNTLNTSKQYIGTLGKVRDQYLQAIDKYNAKQKEAIAGNKTLIEKNQKRDLDDLAGDTRKTMDSTNVMLGVKGASGGSASRQAALAIARSAGKQRAGILTGYGDEFSKQNQQAQNAVEEYNSSRNKAYEWEKVTRQEAMDTFKEQQAALDRLSKKKSGWKDADLKAESDKNLMNFLNSLNSIQAQAKNFRDVLSAKYTEYGGLADELDRASVSIDAPAELETPEFNENFEFNEEEDAEDWFSPEKKGKRVVKGFDAMGNPIYDDEEIMPE